MTLETHRKAIDSLDKKLICLLNERAQHAIAVGKIKEQEQRASLYDPAREAKLLAKIGNYNEGPLSAEHIRSVYREIISACLSLEKEQKVAFLGPEGTFTQMAAVHKFGNSVSYTAKSSIADVFFAVERKLVDFGVVPIENSTEGMVSNTIDMLETTGLHIIGELELPIEHCLLVQRGIELADVDIVYGHEQALAQCKHWLKEKKPLAKVEAVASNALGARMVLENKKSAAIASRVNADLYSLAIAASSIEDIVGNKTRFVVLGSLEVDATGIDKTALLFGTSHRPGGLFQALKHFNDFGLDMTRLESRPSKTASWAYSFFVEFRGHKSEENVKEALIKLAQDTTFVKYLGSFPAALANETT